MQDYKFASTVRHSVQGRKNNLAMPQIAAPPYVKNFTKDATVFD
ncbi:hypothetical protein ABIA96_005417 [Bradyrhizobium sp. LB11.1]